MSLAGGADQRIVALASAQQGRVARWQLLEAGLSSKQIKTRLHHGWLVRVASGVYAVGHTASAPFAEEVTALLRAPRGTVLSHLTAARLWEIHGQRGSVSSSVARASPPGPVDILIPSAGGQRRELLAIHRTVLPQRARSAHVHNLPVTTPTQTLLDIAPLLSPRELERAVDEALARGLTSRGELASAADRDQRRAGSGTLRRLAGQRGPLTRTHQGVEEELLALIREAGLPQPLINSRLHGFEVDFYWPDARLVVEADGYQWHSSRSAFERDRRKDNVLRAAGQEVLRFSWEQATAGKLTTVSQIAGEIASRRAAFTRS